MSCNCHQRRKVKSLSERDQTLPAFEEAEFRLTSLPSSVRNALRMGGGAWPLAVQRAIDAGIRDIDKLTDIAFFMHHPNRIVDGKGRPLSPGEPSYSAMIELWKFLRSGILPLLGKSRPAASGGSASGAPSSGILDRTAFSPKEKRKKTRRVEDIYALVLHQTAFSRGNNPAKYDRVTAHYLILPNGTTVQLHPIDAYLYASNGFNARSVAVEFVGNFRGTGGKCWKPHQFGCHSLTGEQIKAGRFLLKYLVDKIGLTHVLAHRQSSGTRGNDPGPDIWCQVGQWGIDTLGLRDGGPSFKVGSGNPIPEQWRNWCKGGNELEIEVSDCAQRDLKAGPPGFILHDFPAHRTELQRPHREQLTEVRKRIASSFDGDRPIRCVGLIGHAATWRGITKGEYCRRSVARAQAAAEELSAQLSTVGLVTKIFFETEDLDIIDSGVCRPVPGVDAALLVGGRADNQPLLPNLTNRSDNTAQKNRSLNRRVEIWLLESEKEKSKPDSRCELGVALKKVDLKGAPRAGRLECLRNFLILGVCGETVDDRFWTFQGSDAMGTKTSCVIYRLPNAHEGKKLIRVKPRRWHNRPAVFLDRTEKPIRIVELFKDELGESRDPGKIREILTWLDQAMDCNLEMLGQYIELNCDIGKSGFRKDPNCKFARLAHGLATNKKPPSVYQCFERILKEFKTTCVEGCRR